MRSQRLTDSHQWRALCWVFICPASHRFHRSIPEFCSHIDADSVWRCKHILFTSEPIPHNWPSWFRIRHQASEKVILFPFFTAALTENRLHAKSGTCNTAVSHYYNVWLFEMLLIMIPDQYPNYYKALEIYTGYFNSLDIMILFSYPSSVVIMRDYCAS